MNKQVYKKGKYWLCQDFIVTNTLVIKQILLTQQRNCPFYLRYRLESSNKRKTKLFSLNNHLLFLAHFHDKVCCQQVVCFPTVGVMRGYVCNN